MSSAQHDHLPANSSHCLFQQKLSYVASGVASCVVDVWLEASSISMKLGWNFMFALFACRKAVILS